MQRDIVFDTDDAHMLVCGTRGSSPRTEKEFTEFGGDTSCFALRFGTRGVIVDCGTGFTTAARFLAGCDSVDILLTHFHYDHVMGLLSCPSNIFSGVSVTLYAHGFGFDPLEKLHELGKPPFWPAPFYLDNFDVCELETFGKFETQDGIEIKCREGTHPNGVSHYLVSSPEGKRVCFMLDHEPDNIKADAKFAKDCDILVYDGTFTDEEYKQRAGWGHSTVENGIRTMKLAGAGKLLLTHYVSARTDLELRALEKKHTAEHPDVVFARQGEEVAL